MIIPKYLIVMTFLVVSATTLSFTINTSKPPAFKNLKVLPKNITEEELDKVMDGFKVSLGVMCTHCHVKSKENPKEWDFASDEKPEKDIARKMMKMTNRINKKEFQYNRKDTNAVKAVSCYTCHNGKKQPLNMPGNKQN